MKAIHILTINNKQERKFLTQKTIAVDIKTLDKKDLKLLIKQMRELMRSASGVGLSANQIGLNQKFFIAEFDNKFYAIFNPVIIKRYGEKKLMEEGCLSIPNKSGSVKRYEKIILRGEDVNARPLKIKAWGLLAHIFQHEVDHSNGELFIDKAEKIELTGRLSTAEQSKSDNKN